MAASLLGAFQFACAIAALLGILAPSARGQAGGKQGSSAIEGTVSGPQNHPLAGVTVTLKPAEAAEPIGAQTDSQGRYRFSALSPGTYILHANLAGYRSSADRSVTLVSGHVASVNLVLTPMAVSSPEKAATPAIEYSDEPEFTVAGVTDPAGLGGHGSDAVVRAKEALAKDTVALNRGAPDGAKPVSPSTPGSPSAATAVGPPGENISEDMRLGKFLLEEDKPLQALPYLDRASKLAPGNYEISYTLALACDRARQFQQADRILEVLLAHQDRAELHALRADVFEHQDRIVEAAREYARAAQMDPSEPNLFAWGADLLLHRAYIPATEVFEKGHRLFPKSARMLAGLGVASYSRGSAEQGIRQLIEACDLAPNDPDPYLFLGKIQDVEKSEPPEILARFKRFVRLQPQNPRAYYYYAVGLSKSQDDSETSNEVEALLLKSVVLDPRFGDAYLRLGILYFRRRDFPRAIAAYQQAVENTPLPAEAHYRLAQVYREAGKTEDARREIALFDEASKKRADEAERDRRETGQLVYTMRGQSAHVPQ